MDNVPAYQVIDCLLNKEMIINVYEQEREKERQTDKEKKRGQPKKSS
jgi:UDP-glucose 6-dehydrogenase